MFFSNEAGTFLDFLHFRLKNILMIFLFLHYETDVISIRKTNLNLALFPFYSSSTTAPPNRLIPSKQGKNTWKMWQPKFQAENYS